MAEQGEKRMRPQVLQHTLLLKGKPMKAQSLLRYQPRLEALEERCNPTTITDFLNAQGTTSVFNHGVPNLPDEIGWGTSTATINAGTARFARIDYTGQDATFLNRNLGTTTSGSVS